jgi:hypothetical protein
MGDALQRSPGRASMKGSQHGVAKNRAVAAGILTMGLAGIGRPRRRLVAVGSLLRNRVMTAAIMDGSPAEKGSASMMAATTEESMHGGALRMLNGVRGASIRWCGELA